MTNRRSRSVGLAAVLLLVMLGLGAPAAQAHDELASSTPADGATVASVPATISLRFNDAPVTLGARVEVLDSSGVDRADGSVSVTGTTASQRIAPTAPAGAYTVRWRVVSADSHPINGTFTFTVQTASTSAVPSAAWTQAPSSAAAPSAAATQAPPAAGSQEAASPEAASQETSSPSAAPIVIIVLGVLLLVGFGIWMFLSGRRRRGDGTQQ
ncbi:hypothetical protein BKD30_07440 [Tersicoccus phoenicis]|uniref:CopC domain-containing protein n=1 Tax=Tersicoccus phoenicis TaxID=554083 RepID=A0A1R1LBE1_9MICC|nr:hypothetical protein BKD30_07440 [Tersicoccus phoenicis]